MRLTHFGHACVVIDDPQGSRGRILIDPGTLADDVSGIEAVDAVLVTHEHPDHIENEKLSALRAVNADLDLYANHGLLGVLKPPEQERVSVLASGEDSSGLIAGWEVAAHTTLHASIYSALPDITNNGYLVGGRLWHPGDALDVPESAVDVLLLPIGAPWLKLSEAIDYLQAVAPKIAVPIHQGGLQPAHRELHCQLLSKFAPAGTELLVLEPGVPVEL